MHVTKRDGSLEKYNVHKIKRVINWACTDLDINPIELESCIDDYITEGSKTSEMHDRLIEKAKQLITLEEPDWNYVAGRLQMQKIWKDREHTSQAFYDFNHQGGLHYCLSDYKYNSLVETYTYDDIQELNEYIDPQRDFLFDYPGAYNLLNRVLLPHELPQWMFMINAMILFAKEKDLNKVKQLYDYLSTLKLSLATPILINLRKQSASCSSCFILSVGDSLDSIYANLTNAAKISQNGGGVGIYLSNLRCLGSSIQNKKGIAGGVLPWTKLFNDTAVAVNQLGCVSKNSYVKKVVGAYLTTEHEGEVYIPLGSSYSNYSSHFIRDNKEILEVSYDIEETLIHNIYKGDYVLSFNGSEVVPNVVLKSFKLTVQPEDQIKIIYEDGNYITTSNWHPLGIKVNNELTYIRSDKVNVDDITWNDLNEEVKVIAIDTTPNTSSEYWDLEVQNVNNYFASTTNKEGGYYLTHNSRPGAFTLALDSWHMDIYEFIHVVTETGDFRQKSLDIFPQVVLSDLYMERVKNNESWTLVDPHEIKELFNIDLPSLYGVHFNDAYLFIEANKDKLSSCKTINAKELFKEIMRVQNETGLPYLFFKDTVNKYNSSKKSGYIPCTNLCVSGDTLILTDKGYFPIQQLEGTTQTLWNGEEWTNDCPVFKTNENEELIELTFSNGSKVKCTKYHKVPVWNGDYNNPKSFTFKDAGNLALGDKLIKYSMPLIEGNIEFPHASTYNTVTGIEVVEGVHTTYCFTESSRNMGIFNGVLLGNCTENMTNVKTDEEIHVCNLTSLVLANLADDEIETASRLTTRLLDNLVDITQPPIQEAEVHNNKYRNIGIGAMGLADWLAIRDHNYTTGKTLISNLFEDIAYYSADESAQLAIERGAYPDYKNSLWAEGYLFGRELNSVVNKAYNSPRFKVLSEKIKTTGIRNSTLLSIAPNTSTSLLMGCTASILPPVAKLTSIRMGNGGFNIPCKYIKDKFWFYTPNKNVDQNLIVDMVSDIQFWTCHAISMELFFDKNSPNFSPKYHYEVLMNAWEKECKTVYYIRWMEKKFVESEVDLSSICESCSG